MKFTTILEYFLDIKLIVGKEINMLSYYKKQYRKSICKEMDNLKNNEKKCEDNIVALAVSRNGNWKLINNYILKQDREKNKINVKVYRDRKDNKVIRKCEGVTVKKKLKKKISYCIRKSSYKRIWY